MSKSHGFTMIEIVIVVAIVAILASIAIPAYKTSLEKARRSDAITTLLNIQQEEETWRISNTTYGALSDVWSGTDSEEGHYTVAAVGTPDGVSYTFKATPKTTGLQKDDTCGTFAINQDGPVHTGTYADAVCWHR